MVHGHSKFIGLTLKGTRLTPQAGLTLYHYTVLNPNLILTSLNTAVQIANLIMCRGHVQSDRRWTYFGTKLILPFF